jgi:indole-3-acetate monooxygenase
VLEEVARHDSAAAWNLSMSVGGHLFLAWFPDDGVAEILPRHPQPRFAGSFTPGRQARAVDGGYRLHGQWPFVSRSQECHWFVCLPAILEGDQPRYDDRGQPVQRFMMVPATEVTILDTWHTLGMRGTGSHDMVLADVFVPAHQGPLYRLAFWVAVAAVACVALGIARAALDALYGLARTKTPSHTSLGLSQRQVVQRQVAEAEATLGAGRASLQTTFQTAWDTVAHGAPLTLAQKLPMQLAASQSLAGAVTTVDLVHAVAGTAAINQAAPF